MDPLRPARDLLEHLLDGVRACLLVYREETVTSAVDAVDDGYGDDDLDGGGLGEDELAEAGTQAVEAFCAAVRAGAQRDRARLL